MMWLSYKERRCLKNLYRRVNVVQYTKFMEETDIQSKIAKLQEELEQLQNKPQGQDDTVPTDSKEDENYIPIGEEGVFDGEFVQMSNGKKYQVPPNYASKSKLVVGDKLVLLTQGDFNTFKISEQVPRIEVEGILTKKENQWVVLDGDKDYLVISASIRFYEGEIGDKIVVLLPETTTMPVKWAAVKSIIIDEDTKAARIAQRQEVKERAAVLRESYAKPQVQTDSAESADPPMEAEKIPPATSPSATQSATQGPTQTTKRDIVIPIKTQEAEQKPTNVGPAKSEKSDFLMTKDDAKTEFMVEKAAEKQRETLAPIDATDDMPDLR